MSKKVVEFNNEEKMKKSIENVDVNIGNAVDMEGNPTRAEVVEIITQIVDNVNQMADYLMQDVNTMYSQHVFPFQMRLAVLEDIIKENNIATEEEITKKVEERIEKLKERAKEIKAKEESENPEDNK